MVWVWIQPFSPGGWDERCWRVTRTILTIRCRDGLRTTLESIWNTHQSAPIIGQVEFRIMILEVYPAFSRVATCVLAEPAKPILIEVLQSMSLLPLTAPI